MVRTFGSDPKNLGSNPSAPYKKCNKIHIKLFNVN